MKTLAIVLLACWSLLISGGQICFGQIQTVGLGKTSVYYVDRDGDGCGPGIKSSGVYSLGIMSGTVPTTATGDTLDADDQDATVCTTAQWQAKWITGGATDATAIQNFLLVRYGFVPGTSRVAFVSQAGNDATAVMGDATHPFATSLAAFSGLSDSQGGIIVVRGGIWDWSAVNFSSPANRVGGSVGKWLYVMSYPGERVLIQHHGNASFVSADDSFSRKGLYYTVFDGFQVTETSYDVTPGGSDDAVDIHDSHYVTFRNIEGVGWDKTFFIGNHTEHITIEWCVMHENAAHAVYLAAAGTCIGTGDTDFDYDADWALWPANGSGCAGSSRYITVSHNIIYNCGIAGFDSLHMNHWAEHVVLDGNILAYNGGHSIVFARGIYDGVASNNIMVDNAEAPFHIDETDSNPTDASPVHHIKILNNTVWIGDPGGPQIDLGQPFFALRVVSYRKVYDVTIENNVFVAHHFNGWGMLNAGDASNSPDGVNHGGGPDTWVVKNNIFYYWDGTPNVNTDCILYVRPNGYSDGSHAGCYTMAQAVTFASSGATAGGTPGDWTGNIFASPKYVASPSDSSWITTPERFNLRVQAGSPSIGAGLSVGVTKDLLSYDRVGAADLGAYAYNGVAPTPPHITSLSLPLALVGLSYDTVLTATGDGPITWSIVSGALPSWSTLNSSTGELSGWPSAGASTVTVLATGASGNDVATMTLTAEQAALLRGITGSNLSIH